MGVAGGATRTALIQHQARRDNMADVAAKDGSQVSEPLLIIVYHVTMATNVHISPRQRLCVV